MASSITYFLTNCAFLEVILALSIEGYFTGNIQWNAWCIGTMVKFCVYGESMLLIGIRLTPRGQKHKRSTALFVPKALTLCELPAVHKGGTPSIRIHIYFTLWNNNRLYLKFDLLTISNVTNWHRLTFCYWRIFNFCKEIGNYKCKEHSNLARPAHFS